MQRQCSLTSAGTATLCPLQRYLVALLTAAHQHNSGAADSLGREPAGGGGGAAAEAAAVAPLAAALAGRQLRLSALPAATDVAMSAATAAAASI
jgi:hypothetical protein